MKIIAGEKRGMYLACPPGTATRPTLSRVRESLFMVLSPRLEGARVLDLFAGAGGLGLEALSRGAGRATFVENSRKALAALQSNVVRLGFNDRSRIVARDALQFLGQSAPDEAPYNLIILDPPYGEESASKALELIAARPEEWLAGDGNVVAQIGKRDILPAEFGNLHRFFERGYGETKIEMYGRE